MPLQSATSPEVLTPKSVSASCLHPELLIPEGMESHLIFPALTGLSRPSPGQLTWVAPITDTQLSSTMLWIGLDRRDGREKAVLGSSDRRELASCDIWPSHSSGEQPTYNIESSNGCICAELSQQLRPGLNTGTISVGDALAIFRVQMLQ